MIGLPLVFQDFLDYVWPVHNIERRLRHIEEMLGRLLAGQRHISHQEDQEMAVLDQLKTQLAANKDAIDSAVALINGIADRIARAGVDPAELGALVAELRAKDKELADAVLANTEHTEEPPPA